MKVQTVCKQVGNLDVDLPSRLGIRARDRHGDTLVGEQSAGALRPFREQIPVAREIFFVSDGEKIVFVRETVHIEMEDGEFPVPIFVDDGIGRTLHRTDPERATKAAGEGGLPDTHLTVERNHHAADTRLVERGGKLRPDSFRHFG